MIYTELGEWEKVLELSSDVVNLDPTNVYGMYVLANALGMLNRPDEAKKMWNRILDRFPNFTIERYELYLKQGYITAERVKPFTGGWGEQA